MNPLSCHTDREDLQQKRLLYKDRAINKELGLEDAELVTDADNQDTLMGKIGQVHAIDDPEVFVETFVFLQEVETNLRTTFKDILDAHAITPQQKNQVLMALFGRLTAVSSDDDIRSLDALERNPLVDDKDVIELAKAKLQNIAQQAQADAPKGSEGRYFRKLADTVETMGLSKSDLMRTAKLTEQLEVVQDELRNTETKLQLLQKQIDHVNQLEQTLESEEHPEQEVWKRRLDYLKKAGALGIVTGAATAGLGIPALFPVLAMSSTTGVIASHVGSLALVGGFGRWIMDKWKGSGFEDRIAKRAQLEQSILLQRELIEKGTVKVKKDTEISDFIVPDEIRMKKGSVIDGRKVTADEEVAPRGALVTGVVAADKTFTLPTVTVEGDEGMTQKQKLETLKAKQEAERDTVNTLLTEHNSKIETLATAFNADYDKLKQKIEQQQQAVNKNAQDLGIATVRYQKAPDNKKNQRKKEMDQAQKVLDATKAELKRSEEALAEMDRIHRVFELNTTFASVPVSQEVLDALYKQTVNPGAFELMQSIQQKVVERTKKAQKVLGEMGEEKLEQHLEDARKDDKLRKLLIKAGNEDDLMDDKLAKFLDDLKRLRGRADVAITLNHPVVALLKARHPELYEFCMSLGRVSPDTRYAVNKQGRSPYEILRALLKPSDGSDDGGDGGRGRREIGSAEGADAGDEALRDALGLSELMEADRSRTDLEQQRASLTPEEQELYDSRRDVYELLDNIAHEDYLEGVVEQLDDATKTGEIMKYLLQYKLPDSLRPNNDLSFFDGKTLEQALGELDDKEEIDKVLQIMYFIYENCVMSRYPIQSVENGPDYRELKHMKPQNDCSFSERSEFLIYTQEELIKTMTNLKKSIKAKLSISPDNKLKSYSDETTSRARMNNLIVKALLDDPPPGNEDLYAANLEVVEKAIEAGLLTKKANGGFTLADGQDMVLYDLRNGEAQVYKA